MSEPLELRVLSGVHCHARCEARLEDVLGADPACDVVLSDEGVPAYAARLLLANDGWRLLAIDATATSEAPLTPFNQPVQVGPTWITVARPGDPWPELPKATGDGGGAPTGKDNGASHAVSADATALEPAPTTPAQSVVLPRVANRSRRDAWLMGAGLCTVILAVLMAIFMARLPSRPAPEAGRPDPRAAARQSLGKINAVIERLGLSSRLRVNIRPDGLAYVSGWVRNDAERDLLAAALAQIWPMPGITVSSETEALARAALVLKGFAVKYEARYDGDGRMTVGGVARTNEDRDAALAAVRAQLPGMVVMGSGILLADAVAEALSRDLSLAGLGAIALTWRDGRLQAGAGGLDDMQLSELEAVLLRFNARHFGVAKLETADRQYADTVPFGIRAVVSGPTPFIVLDDGSKLAVGGSYRRYRLTAIEDKRLLFEGPRSAIVLS